MFSAWLKSSLITVVLSSIAASAVDSGLVLKVTGPTSVTTVGDLRLSTFLTNTGDRPVKLINDPSGPLSSLPTQKFDVTDAFGAGPGFNGIRIKYSIQKAVESGAITTLEPGQTISVVHDLSSVYNFTFPGQGKYNFQPRTELYVVDAATTDIKTVQAQILSTHSVNITGVLSIARETATSLVKRNVGCTDEQNALIAEASYEAAAYVNDTVAYFITLDGYTDRYSTWFGDYDVNRVDTVKDHFTKISDGTLSSTYDCQTCAARNISDAYAYVYPNEYGTIYLCSVFWDAPTTGSDSKAGTIVHELSHFTVNGGTKDYVYGKPRSQELAVKNPDQAILNADSHEYFAENDPALV
ncbi:hypothetical protein AX15_001373 [Amanita polypyramis BW_CC]|nr:hypothetical protein AX15_001373 [Amanita polypyramis BW_CC]